MLHDGAAVNGKAYADDDDDNGDEDGNGRDVVTWCRCCIEGSTYDDESDNGDSKGDGSAFKITCQIRHAPHYSIRQPPSRPLASLPTQATRISLVKGKTVRRVGLGKEVKGGGTLVVVVMVVLVMVVFFIFT